MSGQALCFDYLDTLEIKCQIKTAIHTISISNTRVQIKDKLIRFKMLS